MTHQPGNPIQKENHIMAEKLKIDIVSDVVCPWCIIGWQSLNAALETLDGEIDADIHWEPFELNPAMPAEGQDLSEHLMGKYGLSNEQAQSNRDMIVARGADVGFAFNMDDRGRIWNTFDAHRLLHWAGVIGETEQTALKMALFRAYFQNGQNPGDHDVLIAAAKEAGLDPETAKEVLTSGQYEDDVRQQEALWQQSGVNSVPTFVINRKHAITGGQPAEVFVRALRQIAEQSANAA